MAKNKYSIESAREALRKMGMKEDKFGGQVINLAENSVGLGGWSMIDFLRGKGVRISVIGEKEGKEKAKEAKQADKKKRSVKTNNSK